MLLRTFLAPTSFVAAVMWTIWAQAAEPITVLAPFNLTGPQAVLGTPCYRGAELDVRCGSVADIQARSPPWTLFAAALIMNYALRPTTSAKIEDMDDDHFTG